SPTHYKEILEFFANHLNAKQVFLWREQPVVPSSTRDGEPPKQKFLALHKTSLEEFEIYSKRFESIRFSTPIHFEKDFLFIKIAADDNQNFCLVVKEYPEYLENNEVVCHIFIKRMAGLLN